MTGKESSCFGVIIFQELGVYSRLFDIHVDEDGDMKKVDGATQVREVKMFDMDQKELSLS